MERQLKKYLDRGRFENVPIERSRTMSAIRGKNNRTTELRLRMALIRKEIRGWQLHANDLPGSPDFYFQKEKLAVFVDGCYWHGCPKCGHIPKTRSKFWTAKIKRTQQRDLKKRLELRKMGIATMRIWEHELKDKLGIERSISRLSAAIAKGANEKRHKRSNCQNS